MNTTLLYEKMKIEGFNHEYITLCKKYADNLNFNDMPVIFDINHLSLLMGIDQFTLYKYSNCTEKLYKERNIPKKNNSLRKILIPSENLKYIQHWVLNNILNNIQFDKYVTGFTKGRSIVDNAKLHVCKECLINIDLKDFFPNIDFMQVYNIFANLGYSSSLSVFFTKICTYKGFLPQGAPTSPILANCACKKLDKRLYKLSNHIGASYTRYADDITFSGNNEIKKYINLIKHIIQNEKFIVNEKKIRVQHSYHKQVVTGLIVNETLKIPIKTKKYLRQQIYYSNKFGVDTNLQNQDIDKLNYKGHLFGLAYFIKMVEEEVGLDFLNQLNKIKWDS